ARCFLPEVGSILWSGPLGPIIICAGSSIDIIFAYDHTLQLLLSDFSHKARCFLPEVGSILWSGPLGPIIIYVARQANCHNDPGNKSLWEDHLSKLGTLAIMDRVNKREIRSIAVQEEAERYKSEQASKFSRREGTSEKILKKRKVTASKSETSS
ncbi:16495_t:CDS:2, partial [Funneliformis mosseae]